MFTDLLRGLLAPAPARLPKPDARLALAALLVRIARTDGLYAVEETERIERILMAHHGIDPFEAARLRAQAEELETEAPDTIRFTRALKAALPLEERTTLLEAMWQVALADGNRDPDEDQLLRLLTHLLGLTDVDSGLARARAAKA